MYNIAPGTTLTPGMFQSSHKPHLWAHDRPFWVMAIVWDGRGWMVKIFEVGSTLTETNLFLVPIEGRHITIESFFLITYHISTSIPYCLIFGLQNS